MALDDRYANKFAPLDSTAIYPKPGHKLLYTPMTGEMKCPRLYLCLAHSIPSPSISMQHMHQHDQQWYDPLHIITWSYWFIDIDFTWFSPLPSSIGAKSCRHMHKSYLSFKLLLEACFFMFLSVEPIRGCSCLLCLAVVACTCNLYLRWLRFIKDFHKYIMHSHSYLRFGTFAMYKLSV